MSWITYLENISNNDLVSFQNKIDENPDLYSENFKFAVEKVLEIHLEFHVQGEEYINNIEEEPDAVWLYSKLDGWSKNGIDELLRITNNEYWLSILNTMMEIMDY